MTPLADRAPASSLDARICRAPAPVSWFHRRQPGSPPVAARPSRARPSRRRPGPTRRTTKGATWPRRAPPEYRPHPRRARPDGRRGAARARRDVADQREHRRPGQRRRGGQRPLGQLHRLRDATQTAPITQGNYEAGPIIAPEHEERTAAPPRGSPCRPRARPPPPTRPRLTRRHARAPHAGLRSAPRAGAQRRHTAAAAPRAGRPGPSRLRAWPTVSS